ncbi:hypothetical protein [Caminicella sporogenes]|uniref:hypothetical protein n=1 Tax=Caminicella sporogenes TaxID=166485 RepID=UPI00254184FF|nr:hypothetical protein [Caminicella sporogenes]WIF95467.1 hypothetical protein QNI18_02155 [Caminicella sporogenes]
MILPKLYLEINKKEDIKEVLEEYCDFILCEPSSNTEEYLFYAKEKLTILATDASGGVYAMISDIDVEKSPIVYVSSEGQSGKIANSFSELISLIIYYPFWKDILCYLGDINKIKEIIPSLEKDMLKYIPNYIQIQKEVGNSLGIIKSEKIIESFIEVVLEKPDFIVYSIQDDEPSETLIGSYVEK